MSDISSVDKNFKIESKIEKENIKFYNVLEKPFKVYGLEYENGMFRRLPEAVAKTISEPLYTTLHKYTAGGRVRFATDSSYVALHHIGNCGKHSHEAFTGTIGFDLYELDEDGKERYVNTFKPPLDATRGFEAIIELGSKKMREFTINFPLFSFVDALYIGLEDDAQVCEHRPYKYEKPIVYYGSSITHGGCASRPGTSYQAFISRRFDANFINLGWSGNAKGEKEMYEYIKKLDMSIFVYDYDHNAPTTEHLAETHEPMFKAIREANPDLPIIIMPRPKYYLGNDEKKRGEIIKRTYENAVAAALAVKCDGKVRNVDVKKVQKILENDFL